MTVPVKTPVQGEIMESVLVKGDLSKLSPEERSRYYMEVCKSAGLNPLTQPFSYITLNGKLILYALRACTDQLRKVNNVSLEIVSRDVSDDILTVHVKARMPDGRVDEDLGAVAFPSTLRGEARANAELKAVTKAKRRATLSICGLGWLDETEIEDIPASSKRPVAAPDVMNSPSEPQQQPDHDTQTGEVIDDEKALREKLDNKLAAAAENGTEALRAAWEAIHPVDKRDMEAALRRRHQPRAAAVDAEREKESAAS